MKTKNDGHDPEAKALEATVDKALNLEELLEPDAVLSGGAEQSIGVLKGLVTFPDEKEEATRVKKLLLIATLISDEEAMKTVAVINEFQRYGISLEPIEFALCAKCAVSTHKQRMSRAELTAQALMRREIAMSRNWKDNGKREKDNSPIS